MLLSLVTCPFNTNISDQSNCHEFHKYIREFIGSISDRSRFTLRKCSHIFKSISDSRLDKSQTRLDRSRFAFERSYLDRFWLISTSDGPNMHHVKSQWFYLNEINHRLILHWETLLPSCGIGQYFFRVVERPPCEARQKLYQYITINQRSWSACLMNAVLLWSRRRI